MLDTLEDSLGVDGIGGTALLIWLGIGVLGLIGSMIYIPQKRKQERITVSLVPILMDKDKPSRGNASEFFKKYAKQQ